MRFVVAITGASGVIYGLRLLEILERENFLIHIIISKNASKILLHEHDMEIDLENSQDVLQKIFGKIPENVIYHHFEETDAQIATGSYKIDGMVIVPCSMGTLGRIASGISSNLIERVADVCLKERRKLILVPRETPLSLVHVENMQKLLNVGATIIPACPGFYFRPKNILGLVDFVVQKILDHLDTKIRLLPEYDRILREVL
jgi:4-hydroxy-3-polyprenylbenzoate decarboxylase